ncbi:hypothetical protein F4861DRAFT_542642 [Xylaria intraflava]|nr:hypothetical protein F4861DRAFT_542642 [Xylaria intraflava]
MSSNAQSFASNNPFRKKLAASSNPAGALNPSPDLERPPASTTARPPPTTFRSDAPENERHDEEQPMQQIPRKIVKKVRVQSPPPSPSWREDAVPVTRRSHNDDSNSDSASGSDSDDDDSSRSREERDPFVAGALDTDNSPSSEPPLPQIPPNPFARTLQDTEGKGRVQDVQATSTNASRGSLDVNSFKRLLLTGHANLPDSAEPSVISKESTLNFPHGTPGTSHEVSESEASDDQGSAAPLSLPAKPAPAPARKKPPPPSSRHGRLIKMELGTDIDSRGAKSATASGASDLPSPLGVTQRKASSGSIYSLQDATNTNKPLPAPPSRTSMEEEIESPFDREAAGKVPEPFAEMQTNPKPPTPPLTTRSRSTSQTSTQSYKPAAPPPRRHGRGDEKTLSMHAFPPQSDEEPLRSSMDSSRSRTEGLRLGINSEKLAPAPPPPRRPGHTRQGASLASNSFTGFPPSISPSTSEPERPLFGNVPTLAQPGRSNNAGAMTSVSNGLGKLNPPPPPPTRKQSTRRPPSVRSMESNNGSASIRKVSREKGGLPPPPPPPRSRASRPPSDLPAEGPRRDSASTISTENEPAASSVLEGGTQGREILADLDALRREVDAFMKKSAGG